MTYRDKLARAATRGHLCVGLDPKLDRIPAHLRRDDDLVPQFLAAIVEATAPFAAAFKPNLAFFEALGEHGDAALVHTIAAVREHAPEALLIGDGKRGDIGSTAERYASALFDRWGFDAATVNPWFGTDGVFPFVERDEHGAFLLAATSNPSSGEIQRLPGGVFLPAIVADLAERQWNERGNVGLVVGATRGDEMAEIRAAGPSLPWLIPGIGAQGGDLAVSLVHGVGDGGIPSMINASRSILYASSGEDFADAAAREAKALADAIIQAR